MLSPAATAAPLPAAAAETAGPRDGAENGGTGGGVGVQGKSKSGLGGVLPGMLEALAVEQQQQEEEQEGQSEEGRRSAQGRRLDDVSLAGGSGRGAVQAEVAAGAAGARGKGEGGAGGAAFDDALTVRQRERE